MIPGLDVGHAHCPRVRTGVTVIVPRRPAVAGVDVRGGGPGTRETDALAPDALVERIHAVVLAGGSVFGLAAADAVALELARQGVGLPLPDGGAVPVVPAAILFDLRNGGDKAFLKPGGPEPPYAELARAALAARSANPAEGPVGAGAGATAGAQPGGVGIARARLDGGGTVAALVVVNSFGDVTAGPPPEAGPVPMPKRPGVASLVGPAGRSATTLACVATDVALSRAAARRLAGMAHDGLARAIRPIHTPFDGDTVFALSLAEPAPAAVDPVLLAELGTRAADCVARACRRAVVQP
ncbi:MAG: P1 family peptidase [Sphingomonadaceae bacterium]|uniref:P1 family peptidase n=1 Tax=Thermaurantiacus sp. TaxID=2820283 RepID=UPI00298EF2A2|nr:P1 family peptidase [Thermaurantiacus sp.]MCS6985924.1 P1 family peptidase [Sphingomonadaceae bacterium]MDW8414860.1 P1 family peptidase [Thermaurantiacus sp.]